MWETTILLLLIVVGAYCEIDCSKYSIDTDFGFLDCDITENLYYNPKMYGGCIPGCQKIEFNSGSLYQCNQYTPCPPGYVCKDNKCQIDEDSCFKYYTHDKAYSKARFKPTCLNDGTWAPLQCKGERCFCYDPKGKRIYGDAFLSQATNMTCACSRKRAEIEAKGEQFFVTLHCDSMGNYEPLQCQDGNCWCVEPKTGEITAPVVPELLMKRLPCYDEEIIGQQYLRQCESHLYAQKKIKDEYNAHGTNRTNFADIKCLYDGSYGPYKKQSTEVYCVWRDNSNLESYFVSQTDFKDDMNCNCARDAKIFSLAGKQLLQKCNNNGNYKKVQKDEAGEDGVEYYCVDDDGFRKSDPQKDPLTDEECDAFK